MTQFVSNGRRGNRRKALRKRGQREGWALAILCGLGLLSTGLFAGMMFGSVLFGVQLDVGNFQPSLRKSHSVVEPNQLIAETRPATPCKTKQEFLNHKAKIGTSGAFPHYPANPLVSKTHDFKSFRAPGGSRFTEYKDGDSLYTYSPHESDELARSRRYHVKKAMEHAWSGYEKYAFGYDELHPVSKKPSNGWGGIGITLVDSLDTLWLMGMKDEFNRAKDWCQKKLTHDRNQLVSTFETTIRSLGGLLAAYDWSRDLVFLDQAKDLGARLFKSFGEQSTKVLPSAQVNLSTGQASQPNWMSSSSFILSEFTTLQVEFRHLARLTGVEKYKTKTEEIFKLLNEMKVEDGLYPHFIRYSNGQLRAGSRKITFGAMGDSCYEYMLKIWIQGGKSEPLYREMYDKSIQGMHDRLLSVSSPSGLVFIADDNNGVLDKKMDHLVCFMGGLLALGAYTDPQGLDSDRAQRDLKTAKALTYTCYQMYARMPTGISPEYVQFHEGEDFDAGMGGAHYLLRPETVESFFVLYHLTGDPIYREWGWEVFQSIERYCKTEAAYGKLADVKSTTLAVQDNMESFFLAETLKYIYLLFDPDTPIDLLNKHVFNTEAHPMRILPTVDEEMH